MTYLEHCQYRHFDGVCIVCADYDSEEVIRLAESDLPIVTIDNGFPKSYSIISDNYGGMKQLTNFILRQGHKKIALIHGISKTQVTQNRMEGFFDALKEHRISVPKKYVLEGLYRHPMLAEELACRLLSLDDPPTCIIAPDDQSAIGVINAIRKKGLQPVRDISVAGYDGIESLQLIGVKLTTADRSGITSAERPQEN